jgi:hypothetical protein
MISFTPPVALSQWKVSAVLGSMLGMVKRRDKSLAGAGIRTPTVKQFYIYASVV